MDTFAALALATEAPSMALLNQKPYARDESIFTPVMWRNIIGQAIYQIIIFITLLFIVQYDLVDYDFIHRGEDEPNTGYCT